MSNEALVEKPGIRLWSPRTIGWLTLILYLIIGFGALAGGFVLAAINWYRAGPRRKAVLHLIIGPVLVVFFSTVDFLLGRDSPLYLIKLLVYLTVTFLVVAYLHKATERIISRLQSGYDVQQGNLFVAIGIVVVVALVMIVVQMGVNYGVAILQTPKVESTATLMPGGDPAIIGAIHLWTEEDGPIEGRRIVLCELVAATRLDPYDCTLTNFTATTDEEGRFKFGQVPAGKYLIFYDSGLADFDSAVEGWAGKEIRLGDRLWMHRQGFFKENPDRTFSIFWPEGEKLNDFYHGHIQLTLMAGGSPFFVAHDIEVAMSAKYESDNPFELPPGVFIPASVEVVEGYTCQIEFDVLYRGN